METGKQVWTIKKSVGGRGNRPARRETVGRAVMRDERRGVLYLAPLDGDFPVFLSASQDEGPHRLVYSVTKAKTVQRPKPGGKPVIYEGCGRLVLTRDGSDGTLEMWLFNADFIAQAPVVECPAQPGVAA